MFGVGARKDIGFQDCLVKFCFRHRFNFSAGHHRVMFNAELFANGLCRRGMVAGNHLHLDASLVAALYCVYRFFAWRIVDTNYTNQGQVIVDSREFQFRQVLLESVHGNSQRSLSLAS